jgi:hypothetical protein
MLVKAREHHGLLADLQQVDRVVHLGSQRLDTLRAERMERMERMGRMERMERMKRMEHLLDRSRLTVHSLHELNCVHPARDIRCSFHNYPSTLDWQK